MTAIACATMYAHASGRCGPVMLRYDDTAPLEVRLSFVEDNGVTVPWTVAREVLADGLTHLAGVLDVRCWTEGSAYCIRLSNPKDGSATMRLPVEVVRAFLTGTEALVPYGAEVVDFDAELSKLLIGDW